MTNVEFSAAKDLKCNLINRSILNMSSKWLPLLKVLKLLFEECSKFCNLKVNMGNFIIIQLKKSSYCKFWNESNQQLTYSRMRFDVHARSSDQFSHITKNNCKAISFLKMCHITLLRNFFVQFQYYYFWSQINYSILHYYNLI